VTLGAEDARIRLPYVRRGRRRCPKTKIVNRLHQFGVFSRVSGYRRRRPAGTAVVPAGRKVQDERLAAEQVSAVFFVQINENLMANLLT